MISDCCWERIIDPWNTGEWICSECKEHCESVPESSDEEVLTY